MLWKDFDGGGGRGKIRKQEILFPIQVGPVRDPPPTVSFPPAISCASGMNLILNINKPEAHHPREAQTL